MLQSSAQQAQQMLLESELQGIAKTKNGLHQLLMSTNNQIKTAPTTTTTNNHQVLLGMLQSPLSNSQQQEPETSNQPINSDYGLIYRANPLTNCNAPVIPEIAGMAALVQIQQLANHVSTVLGNFGLQYVHQNNVFTVDHLGVRFQIHVAGNIQLQYVAGDMTQYQSLCSQLYNSLIPTTQL